MHAAPAPHASYAALEGGTITETPGTQMKEPPTSPQIVPALHAVAFWLQSM
jgi:hypothetical protein